MKLFTKIAITSLALSALPVAAHAQERALPITRCVNMGNSLEFVPESRGGKRIDAADFARIKAAGFDTVRIPVRWSSYSTSEAPHIIDPAFMARVTEVVDMALDAGLKVALNDHYFEGIFTQPLEHSDWLAAIWEQIAVNFADRPVNRLFFEIENEPHENLSNGNLAQTLAPALAAIRKTNPDRPVIIGGENWSGVDSLATLNLPDDPYVFPTFHYYEPFDFTHQGARWVAPNVPEVGRIYGTEADHERLRNDVAKVKAYIARTGMVPLMGESGAYEAHIPLEQRVAYTRAVYDAFAPEGVGICLWAYANTFPVWDRDKGEWIAGFKAAMGLPEE